MRKQPAWSNNKNFIRRQSFKSTIEYRNACFRVQPGTRTMIARCAVRAAY